MTNQEKAKGILELVDLVSGKYIGGAMHTGDPQSLITNNMMAREMIPSKEEWEQLGFIFADIPGNQALCYATLPEGWSMEYSQNYGDYRILDENGMRRGTMIYEATSHLARMSLRRRYGLEETCHKVCDQDSKYRSIIEVYFGNEQEKLFIAGEIRIPRNCTKEEDNALYSQIKQLRAMAKQFADENYPDWQSVHAYWGNNRQTSQEPSKK